MKVLVQWACSHPGDWVEVDSKDWSSLPAKADRAPVDDTPGHVACLNVQGVHFFADHYHVEHVDDETIKVTVWEDDPGIGVDWCYAMVWTFKTLAADPALGGIYNTRQACELYAEPNFAERYKNTGHAMKPWKDFKHPTQHVRHGRTVPDELWAQHEQVRTLHGWRNWHEGIPAEDIENGRVKHRPGRPG